MFNKSQADYRGHTLLPFIIYKFIKELTLEEGQGGGHIGRMGSFIKTIQICLYENKENKNRILCLLN